MSIELSTFATHLRPRGGYGFVVHGCRLLDLALARLARNRPKANSTAIKSDSSRGDFLSSRVGVCRESGKNGPESPRHRHSRLPTPVGSGGKEARDGPRRTESGGTLHDRHDDHEESRERSQGQTFRPIFMTMLLEEPGRREANVRRSDRRPVPSASKASHRSETQLTPRGGQSLR